MQDAAKEYVEVPKEERRERCYLIHGKQHDILEGVIELEEQRPHKVPDTLWVKICHIITRFMRLIHTQILEKCAISTDFALEKCKKLHKITLEKCSFLSIYAFI